MKNFLKQFMFIFSKKKILLITCGIVILALLIFYVYSIESPPVLPQRAISSLKDVQMPTNGQKVLFFSPHPDDETIAAAGYISQAGRVGAIVRIILVTNGNKHHNEGIRYTEFKSATSILGVKPENLVFLGLQDGQLDKLDKDTLNALLKSEIDSYNPDIVIYPDSSDLHPDHSTTGKAVEAILKISPGKITAFEYLVHYGILYPQPRKFDIALYLLPPKKVMKADREWQRVMLAQDVEDEKALAIFTYNSQLKNPLLRELMLYSIRKNELLAVPK